MYMLCPCEILPEVNSNLWSDHFTVKALRGGAGEENKTVLISKKEICLFLHVHIWFKLPLYVININDIV